MANPFFTNLLDLISGNRARASEVEANLSAVEAGFDGVYEYLTRALRGPQAGGTIAEMPSAASRANKVLVFDASGNPTMATPTDAMNAVNRSGDTMTGPLNLPSNGLAVGTNQLVVSGGNVGVGGTPSTRFHVQGGRLRLDANSEQYATQLNYSAGGGANGHFLGGASDGSFLISNSGGAEKVRVDQPTGSLLVTGSGGLGYGVGSGGTVTQPTSKSTAVTLNKPCGQITMNNAALAAGASVQFQVNNNLAAGADGVVLNITGGTANASSYRVIGYVQGNAFLVRLTNESGGSLSDAVVINFGLFKGATS